MKTSDFNFDLPEHLIAQHPLEDRTASRLMVLNRKSKAIEHKKFHQIIDLLNEGDCLVLNDTRVLPARLFGIKEETGAKVEFLLLENRGGDIWQCMVKPGKKAHIGSRFNFGGGLLQGEIVDYADEGTRLIKFNYEGTFQAILDELGTMPLPPYITAKLEDRDRYQTVFNRASGSSAAPTAGLHFSQSLLQSIKDKGIKVAYVTLHVGLGTFRPVKVENVLDHHMHAEWYELTAENAAVINGCKAGGGRVIAVGTTSTRTLETIATHHGQIQAATGWTDIFIYPGYQFKAIDALITNFHLPESTLLMLISAFYNKEEIMQAYACAVDEEYRFFSFGDAMFIV